MTVLTVGSDDARTRFRDLLDTVFLGGQVIINRNKKPSAVMIGHTQWQQIKANLQRLQELEMLMLSRQRYEAMKADPSQSVSEEEYQQLLKAEGLDE